MQTSELLKKVRQIEIKTRRLSQNIFAGQYHSAFKGRGMAFSEVREYQYGDDVRDIDWNVTARFHRPYVKVFEEERELTVMLLVDVSGSLDFGTIRQTKRDMVAEIAATLDSLSLKPHTKLTINFATEFNVVPYDSISQYKNLISDHIVLVGSTTDQSDLWNSSIGTIPGVVLQAYSVETIRNHRDITYPSTWVSLLIAFVLCYIFELIIDVGVRWLKRRKDTFSVFLDESYLGRRVVTIIFFALVAWALAEAFAVKSIYLNAVLILVLLGFVLEARNYYFSAIKALVQKHDWWILKNSLINQ